MVKTYGSVNGQSKQIKTLYGSVNGQSKKIKKLYASVNGQSKLIYDDSGYTPTVPYGIVYYKANASDTTELSVELQSEAEFNSLCNSSNTWSATLGGGAVTVNSSGDTNIITGVEIGYNVASIGDNFLRYCYGFNRATIIPDNVNIIGAYFLSSCSSLNQPITLPDGLTAIGNYFLYYCTSFNQSLAIPSTVTSIGNYFLSNCTVYNQPLTLPSNVTSIGASFLRACSVFNQPLAIPRAVTSIGTYFLYQCNNMVSTINVGAVAAAVARTSSQSFATNSSTAPMYTTGITVIGSNRSEWLARFSNRTSSPYRKLIDGGSNSNYGVVYYEKSTSDAIESSVELQSVAEFNSLCNSSSTWSATIGGGAVTVNNTGSTNVITGVEIGNNITSIGNYFLYGCDMLNASLTVPDTIASIGDNFLSNCTSFNRAITLPSSLNSIGDSFLSGCISFGKSITIPSMVTNLGSHFLQGCVLFNSNIVLPRNITSIGSHFLYNCSSMIGMVDVGSLTPDITTANNYSFSVDDSSAPAYTIGVVIVGENSRLWQERFSNRDSAPYRNTYAIDTAYGRVHYKANASDTTELSVELQSKAEFDSLASSSTTWSATIGGGAVTVNNTGSTNVITGVEIGYSITSIGNSFLRGCSLFNSPVVVHTGLTSIGEYFLRGCSSFNSALTIHKLALPIDRGFLYSCESFNQPIILPRSSTINTYFMVGCTSFNQPLTLPNGVTKIDYSFLENCASFNQPLTLPSSLTDIQEDFLQNCASFNQMLAIPSSVRTIDQRFLSGCSSFNQPIIIPSNITFIGSGFMKNCDSMTSPVDIGSLDASVTSASTESFATSSSTAPMYTTGVPIKGSNRAAWLARFPNSTASPYRKLIDGGE